MGVSEILAQIDREIALLQQARTILGGGSSGSGSGSGRSSKGVRKKRNLTPEGRKRIAEAVKRRWAEQKKASSSK